jgi:hypothetical protein
VAFCEQHGFDGFLVLEAGVIGPDGDGELFHERACGRGVMGDPAGVACGML